MFSLIRPLLFNIDPEKAHGLAIKSLEYNCLPKNLFEVEDENLLKIELFGKIFPNPIGLAAGFDKSAEVFNKTFKLGFGFIEVGTVTPLKQFGNPKPRVFRLEEDRALINRLGFNNDGSNIIRQRIIKKKKIGILGINIGPNKDTKSQSNDFCSCLETFCDIADYITINISSPNTENLRNFHEEQKLENLLLQLNKIKKNKKKNIPLLVKVSPDINNDYIESVSAVILRNSISGIIVSNSTNTNRLNLFNKQKNEEGGLSGLPLKNISTNLIGKFYKKLDGKIPIIGVGGVDSGESAYEKIIAGASLVQLYTGLVYQGPFLIKKIKNQLVKIIKSSRFKNISEAIGSKANNF